MTKIGWGRQLTLATALFALGSFAYWMEFKQKPKREAATEQEKKLFRIKDTPIHSARLTNGANAFDLSCSDVAAKLCKPGDNSKWELTEPTKLKADDSNVNSLISSIAQLSVSETIDLNDETAEKRAALLKEYGLSPEARNTPATRKLFVRTPSGETIVYFGVTHPIGDSIFAAVEQVKVGTKPTGAIDEIKIYLVPNHFKAHLERDLTHWRDKKLMTLAAHEVESFALDGSKGHIAGIRKEGHWTLRTNKAKADELPGDIENIDNLLTSATYLSAKGFVSDRKDDAKAKTTLKGFKTALTLTVQKEKGTADKISTPVVLTLYQKPEPKGSAGKLYATVSNLDPLFELDSHSKERIDKALKDLRLSKLITSMERFGAKRLEFTGSPIGPTPVTLSNSSGKWIDESDKIETDQEKVQNLLDRLSGNRIKDFLIGSAIPTGEQNGVKFNLGGDSPNSKRAYVFWKSGEKLYARDMLSNRKEALMVDASIKAELPWERTFFQKTKVPAPAGSGTPQASGSKH